MNDSKNSTKSGSFKIFALAVAAIAMCALLMGLTDVLLPAGASSSVPATATYAGPTGYLPAQLVNQATEVEPMPEMYE